MRPSPAACPGPAARQSRVSGTALLAALVVAAAALAFAPATRAQTCAGEAISARGETSQWAWFARTKARANWRARVRGVPDLGDAYANWNRAKDAEETCYTGPEGTLCVLSGVPCRK